MKRFVGWQRLSVCAVIWLGSGCDQPSTSKVQPARTAMKPAPGSRSAPPRDRARRRSAPPPRRRVLSRCVKLSAACDKAKGSAAKLALAGYAALKKRDYRACICASRQALSDPTLSKAFRPAAAYNLGRCYEAAGCRDKAGQAYRRSVSTSTPGKAGWAIRCAACQRVLKACAGCPRQRRVASVAGSVIPFNLRWGMSLAEVKQHLAKFDLRYDTQRQDEGTRFLYRGRAVPERDRFIAPDPVFTLRGLPMAGDVYCQFQSGALAAVVTQLTAADPVDDCEGGAPKCSGLVLVFCGDANRVYHLTSKHERLDHDGAGVVQGVSVTCNSFTGRLMFRRYTPPKPPR